MPQRIFERVGTEQNGRRIISSVAEDMLIDRFSRLWYATWGQGIVRYDGYNYRYYQYDALDSNSLSINRVSRIIEDSRGNIWAATLEGLNCIDVQTGKCRRYYLPVNRRHVTSVFEHNDSTFLIGENRGFWELNVRTGKFARWQPLNGGDPEKAPGLGAFMKDAEGRIWAECSRGLLRLYPYGKRYELIPFQAPGVPSGLGCSRILQDSRHTLWICTRAGLFNYFPDKQRFERAALPDSLAVYPALDLLEDADGSLWIGYYGHGLAHWVPGGPEAERFSYTPFRHNSLSSDEVNVLRRDRFGNLWIATGHGINKINTRPPNFKFYQLEAAREDRRNRLFWVMEDEAGGLLMRFAGNGIAYSPGPGAPAEMLPAPPGKGFFIFKNGVSRSPEGQLWVAWTRGGLSVWERATRTFSPFLQDTAFGGRTIQGHCHDRDDPDVLWIGLNTGLVRLDKKSLERKHFRLDAGVAGNNNVGKIADDGRGGLWFDVRGGLGYFIKKTGEFRIFKNETGNRNSLVSNEVVDISVAPDASVWIGTTGGLSHIRVTDAHAGGPVFRFENYDQHNGLRRSMVQGVIAGIPGQVWLGAMEDIVRLDTKTGEFTFYNIATTLQCGLTVRQCLTASPSGVVYAAGMEGLIVFDPARMATDLEKPQVLLTNILINNEAAQGLDREVEFVDFLSLASDKNALTFEFVGVHTVVPVFNRYSYRLEGYDTAWVNSGDLRRASYTNLPPGSYTFRVNAANPDGVWSEEGAALRFVIAPHFWQSQWFRFLMLLVVSAVLYAIISVRMQQRRLAQQKELAEQNARYRSQFLANMSHEIRTPMNAILGLSHLLAESPLDDKQREYIGAISHSSEDLLRIVNDILDYSKIESGRFSFQQKPFDLQAVLDHLEKTFSFRAKEKGIGFKLFIEPETPSALEGDPLRLTQILTNLIGNAIKFTESGGVSISVASEEISPDRSTLCFSVRDTGIGIPPEKLETVFESFSQVNDEQALAYGGTGLGLSIAKQLVELQGGQIGLQSSVGAGTTVAFEIRYAVQQTPATPARADIRPVPVLKDLYILLVEDTYFNQLLALELLKSKIENARVDVAENGQAALDRIAAASYDLILMDVKMPVMDGLEATRRIRSQEDPVVRNLPIVGLTANAVPEELEKCRLAGMDRWVTKPISVDELMSAIRAVMNGQRFLNT